MNSYERVATALAHEAPDRCPMRLSWTAEFLARLRADVEARGFAPGEDPWSLPRQLGSDVIGVEASVPDPRYDGSGDARAAYTDDWGITWTAVTYHTRFGDGIYYEPTGHPLADDAAISGFVPPDPHLPGLYDAAAATIAAHKGRTFISGWAGETIWERAWQLRGFEQAMMDLIADPDLADAILDLPFRYHTAIAEQLTRLGVDLVYLGDDVGMQDSMMISPALWRRYLKPRMAELIGRLRAINPDVKILYDSDGYIEPIIPDIIEIGVDVLFPVQPACMDPADIKRRFGKHLSFLGTMDVQRTLPFGTPEDVRAEVRTRLATVGRDGGLILAPSHMIQLDTPLENFWAMVEEVQGLPARELLARVL